MSHRTRYFVIASLLVLAVGLGTGLVAYYVGFPGGVLSNDLPVQLSFVPADSPVVAYANVHELMASDLRQALRERFPANGQREFAARTGINIERDVDSVVGFLGGSAADGTAEGLAVIRGRFDRHRIENLLKEHGGREESYSNTTIIVGSGQNPVESIGAAFLADDLFGIGHVDQLRAAINRKTADAGATSSRDLLERIRAVNGQSAWVVGRFDALVASGHLPAHAVSAIPAITWLTGSLRIDHSIHIRIQADARDEQAANDLRGLVTGVLAVGKLQRAANPELADLARSVVLGGSATKVTLSFDAPPRLLNSIRSPRDVETPAPSQ